MMPSTQLARGKPDWQSAQTAKAKIPSSIARRRTPGTGIGADPERLGSPGTANVPHRTAATMGTRGARAIRCQPVPERQPQSPKETRADTSSRNRTVRLIGWEPTASPVHLNLPILLGREAPQASRGQGWDRVKPACCFIHSSRLLAKRSPRRASPAIVQLPRDLI